jgi:putative transposase
LGSCSIPKLFHPPFEEHQFYISRHITEKSELIEFLAMVKLKQKKLKWAIKEKEKGLCNKSAAERVGVGVRRFQQLHAQFKATGQIPRLSTERRPRKPLTEEEKKVIDLALHDSGLKGAVSLRLHILKHEGRSISHNKIHQHLLRRGVSREDPKKKKQHKYCRYERDHGFSLVHLDWHESRAVPGKQVCVVEDDASRFILSGDEFDDALAEYNIGLVKQAMSIGEKQYSATIREVNTDRGSQFYANRYDHLGEKGVSEFELFLQQEGIRHILSRRNHPQTNGKEERWFRTYEENRARFSSFREFIGWYNNRIHLGLSRREGITPDEALMRKLQPASLLGLFWRLIENGSDA